MEARAAPLIKLCYLVISTLLLTGSAAAATVSRTGTQNPQSLRLPAGRDVTVRGSLRPGPGRERVEYVFHARAGQRVSVRLTSNRIRYGEGVTAGAVLFVLDSDDRQPPDFGDYFYGGPVSWDGRLPRAGTYRIRVLIEDGPDDPPPATLRRMNARVDYKLVVRFPRP